MIACDTSLQELERLWGGGKLSNEELIGCLLRYLAKQERAKHQEPRTENREPRTENREPRTGYGASRLPEDPDAGQLKTQHSKRNTPAGEELKTPSIVLGSLLRQIGDVLDALTGQQLELWHAEGLWYWRWEDTDGQARCGLASYGEALVDAVERRYPDELLPAALRGG
ncbi:MAG TPA: hypothetical protein VFS21_25600 [Roseiflexaceae bacterium]|nr:hypothetical protein [Roseiflexaceae bacterium]